MSNVHKERVDQIRSLMEQKGIDLYFIPMDDCHNSEYVGEHFKTIEFVSGFTGSAAKVVIAKDEACLWTDGRYFLQASMELEGSDIQLMKMGEDGVPAIEDYINGHTLKGEVLGFEGKVVSTEFAKKIGGRIVYDEDFVDQIWTNRPGQQFSELLLFEDYAGESVRNKLNKVREKLAVVTDQEYIHILNSLDDIAWLFNIRAKDVDYNPVAYAYAKITKQDAEICLGDTAVTEAAGAFFAENGIRVGSYQELQKDPLSADSKKDQPVILLDPSRISYDMYMLFADHGYEVIDVENPTTKLKAVKNAVEIANTKKAQKKDGIAMVQFMKWIKENAGKMPISECDVSDKLAELRSRQEGFLEPSFATIAGYASNAAIIHYEPERGKDAAIEAKGMLLVDSGGHYLEGTTDVTRTFILGEITEEERKCFSLVAAAMLRLMDFDSRKAEGRFNGLAGDAVARKLLQEHGYDYNHGTGHGIGHVLNVHENPPCITRIARPGNFADEEFAAGMISSDEPGIYIDGSFGIRTENDMLVVEKQDAEGRYLAFENLTIVPIDIDGLDKQYLTEDDVSRINAYNRSVYETLADSLDEETRNWLAGYTQSV